MSKKQSICNSSTYQPLEKQSGVLYVPLTNDILFKLLMQENQDVLKSFLCALLKLKPSDITSIQITNTYIPGKTVTDKQIILDINMILNNSKLVNLEMQVLNKGDWKERSLFYLCNNFNKLTKGEVYTDLLPTHHIGILDFSLPDLDDAFYQNFYLMEFKSHKIYSDKLILSVLNLEKIELATEEEKESGLHYWAQLFKTTTWEELKMLAKQDTIFESAANTVNELLQEHRVRYECRRREIDLNADRKWKAQIKAQIAEQADTITEQADTITELKETNSKMETALTKANADNAKKDARIAELEALLKSQN